MALLKWKWNDWGNPEEQVKSSQFFEVPDACNNKLPAAQGRLFLMRECLELNWFAKPNVP